MCKVGMCMLPWDVLLPSFLSPQAPTSLAWYLAEHQQQAEVAAGVRIGRRDAAEQLVHRMHDLSNVWPFVPEATGPEATGPEATVPEATCPRVAICTPS